MATRRRATGACNGGRGKERLREFHEVVIIYSDTYEIAGRFRYRQMSMRSQRSLVVERCFAGGSAPQNSGTAP